MWGDSPFLSARRKICREERSSQHRPGGAGFQHPQPSGPGKPGPFTLQRKETLGWEGISGRGPSSSGAAGHVVERMRGQTRTPSRAPGCRSRTLGPRVARAGGRTLPLPFLGGSHSPYTPTRTPRGPGVLQGGWVKSEQRWLPREPRGLATGPCASERQGCGGQWDGAASWELRRGGGGEGTGSPVPFSHR